MFPDIHKVCKTKLDSLAGDSRVLDDGISIKRTLNSEERTLKGKYEFCFGLNLRYEDDL